jgi:hypothetical protein
MGVEKLDSVRDPEAILRELRDMGERIDLFTFMQMPPETDPKFEYYRETDNLAVLPVSTFENWWNNQIRSYPRNRARQAEKRGVVLREVGFDDEFVTGIWRVYNESRVRQGRPNLHYGKGRDQVRKETETYLDRSVFIGAFLESELIGFVKLILNEERTQASLVNIVAMIGHRDKAPTNALIAHSVNACAQRGIREMIYQSFEYGNKGPDSMTHFKEINGFQKVDLPKYYIPLSVLGRIALRLGLHHPFSERLPRPVIQTLLTVRKAWYDRRLPHMEEAS